MRIPERTPSRRRIVARRLAASAVVAFVCAIWSVYHISLLPPHLTPRHVEIAGAASHVLVDGDDSYILDGRAQVVDFTSLAQRTELFGTLMASPEVRELIGRRIGVPANQIAAIPRLTAGVPDGLRDPDFEQAAVLIKDAGLKYRLDIQPDPLRPVLHVYTQAPTSAQAVELADAAVASLREYLGQRAKRQPVTPGQALQLEQLGPARGGTINGKTRPQIILLTFLVAFAATFALLSATAAILGGWRAGRGRRRWRPMAPPTSRPALDQASEANDMWPNTTRLLPWTVAGFMAMLWLVPFNTIELSASLPFDLKLDRIVLPFIVGLWLLSLAVGGRNAPRVRMTPIHAAVAVLGLVVAIGVVLNALSLNQTLEFDLGVKKLSLLFSYGVFFVVVASSVRPAEVPAFLKFTLGLAVIAALGTVWEARMGYNVFYDVSGKLLPSVFDVGESEAGLFDTAGRALTRGPGEHPLEIVAMLSMALPIALMGMLDSRKRRTTVLFGVATAILLAAALSTDRKTSLLAPLSVALVFAYYRRVELMKLAPLGVVLAFAVQFMAPGAITSVLLQLSPAALGVDTVSDRAADYDAVRPDMWSHLLLGRGYGTYDHVTHRILDSEMLNRLIDTGVLGLFALIGMLVTIVVVASPLIRMRHPRWSPPALVAAPAAVAYLVLGFLFDVGSFPHAPYILMSIAGLTAVMVAAHKEAMPGLEAPDPLPPYLVDRAEADRPALRFSGMEHRILIISPVRNEAAHIERVVRAVAAQELQPARWIISDDRSTDDTLAILRRLEAEVPFLTVQEAGSALEGPVRDRLAKAAAPRNFNEALHTVDWREYTHIMKLDGDIELPPTYLRDLMERFDREPALGLAGGVLVEPLPDGKMRHISIPRHHVHGALKCYSRDCFEAIGGVQERLGWDTIDGTYARMRGYTTRSFTDLVSVHHRPIASADGVLRGRARHGECAYIAHYSLPWVAGRSLKVALSRPYGLSGAYFLYGYLRAAFRRVERVPDRDFRRFTRRELRQRMTGGLQQGGV
jgi:hypothetical protein